MNLKFFTLSLMLAAVVYSASSQTIVYVNKNATGIPIDGTTWSRAYRDLGQALTASTTISGNVQIWVAAGVYYPTTTTNRSISFQISRANLTVSGGFAGNETNFSQRNLAANEVVLSGNIGSTGTNADNSLQVVQVNNAAVNATTYLTGLRISDANSTTTGGGLVVSAGFLSISDCKFSDNNTSEHGAGLFLGGLQGLSNQNIIDRCVFYDNYANRYGGGAMISVGRSAKFTNCLFYNNSGIEAGGAIMVGNANAEISNCTFSKNHSSTLTGIQYYRGSAICFLGTNSNNAVHKLSNSIVVRNTPFNDIQVARPANYGTFSHNLFEGIGYGANVLTFNPSLNLFADAESDDYRIDKFCSQAYNEGTTIAGIPNLDLDGNQRISRGKIDLGAYEYNFNNNSSITGIITCSGLSTGAVTLPNAGSFSTYYLDPDPSNGWDNQNSVPFYNGLDAGKYYTAILQDGCPNITPLDSVTILDAPVLSFTGSVKPVNCNGAADAQIQVSSIVGGFGAATRAVRINFGSAFSAPRTFSGINVGVVTVTLSQLTCSKNYFYTITQPSALNAGVYGWSNVQCNGQNNGTVVFSPSGGVKPYSYSILGVSVSPYTVSGGDFEIGNLSQGNKTLTMRDANGCTVNSINFTINQPPAIVASIINKKNVSCFGTPTGIIVATATGGNQNSYIYSISNEPSGLQISANTISGLTNGTYNVIVSDLYYCKTTIVGVTITTPSALNVGFARTNNLCSGLNQGSITLSGSGGVSPYQYRWDEGAYQASNVFSDLFQGFYAMSIKDANHCTSTVTGSLTDPLPFDINIKEIAPTCNGYADGKLLVTLTGGTGSLSTTVNGMGYTGNFTASGLSALQPYQLRIKDQNGCLDFYNAQVPDKEILSLTGIITKTTCEPTVNDWVLSLTATGGNGDFTYKINNDAYAANSVFPNLGPSTVLGFTKDILGCVTSITSVITPVSNPLNASISTKSDLICNSDFSGAFVVIANGGAGGYVFKLNNNSFQALNTFTGLSSGLKTIAVRDQNNCVVTLTSTLNEPSAIATMLVSKSDVLCKNTNSGSLVFSASGGTGTLLYNLDNGSYVSENTFTGLNSGLKTLSVKDQNGCITTISSFVNEPQDTLSVSATVFGNDSIQVMPQGGTQPYTISVNQGTVSENGFVKIVGTGTYTITVEDANKCSKTVQQTVAINGAKAIEASEYAVFPNPNEGNCSLFAKVGSKVKIYGTNSVLVNEFVTEQNETPIRLNTKGLYLIVVSDGGFIKTLRVNVY